jgi:predicted transcriptional regulator
MQNNLSPEYAQYIDQLVANGVYDSPRGALDAAVSLLIQRDRLRSDVQAGIDQADRGELLPDDEVFARLECRAREIESRAQSKQ